MVRVNSWLYAVLCVVCRLCIGNWVISGIFGRMTGYPWACGLGSIGLLVYNFYWGLFVNVCLGDYWKDCCGYLGYWIFTLVFRMFWFGLAKLAKSSKSCALEDNLFVNVGFFYIFYTNFGETGWVLSKF